jgi:hypothetical protein
LAGAIAVAVAGVALAAGTISVNFTANVAARHTTAHPVRFNIVGRVIPPPYVCPAGGSCTKVDYATDCNGPVSIVGKISGQHPPGGLKTGTTVATANTTIGPKCTYSAYLRIFRSALKEHHVRRPRFVQLTFTASYGGNSYFAPITAAPQHVYAKGVK